MSPAARTAVKFSSRCPPASAKAATCAGLLACVLSSLRNAPRAPRLDLDSLNGHQLRDLGLADGRPPRRADRFRY